MTTKAKARPVIVTTQWKGVFFGYATDTSGETIDLTNCRMAIRFGTTRGILELAETGPTRESRIGARAPTMQVRGITAVIEVSPEATKKWEAA